MISSHSIALVLVYLSGTAKPKQRPSSHKRILVLDRILDDLVSLSKHSIFTITGDGQTNCSDVDECADGTDDCPDISSCENLTAGFGCTCVDVYQKPANENNKCKGID